MSKLIDISSLPKDQQNLIYNLHAQKLSKLAGHKSGSSEESYFIAEETKNMMDGHPSGKELTSKEYLEMFPTQK